MAAEVQPQYLTYLTHVCSPPWHLDSSALSAAQNPPGGPNLRYFSKSLLRVVTRPFSGQPPATLKANRWPFSANGCGTIQANLQSIQYDANFRITSITDAINQVSTISYVSNTIGNSGFYKVSTISDPFGRSASFAYDSTNTYLTSITDCIGLKSSFTYDTSTSDVASMITAYGVTSFSRYTPTTTVPSMGLKVTMPDKSTYIYENWAGEPKTSYFWSREVLATYPSDPARHDFSHAQSALWIVSRTM